MSCHDDVIIVKLHQELHYLLLCFFYLESQRSPIPTVYVVNAGTEHLEFTNLFPYWREDPNVKARVSMGCGPYIHVHVKDGLIDQ